MKQGDTIITPNGKGKIVQVEEYRISGFRYCVELEINPFNYSRFAISIMKYNQIQLTN